MKRAGMGHREGCSVLAFYVTMKNKNFQCLDCKWLIERKATCEGTHRRIKSNRL